MKIILEKPNLEDRMCARRFVERGVASGDFNFEDQELLEQVYILGMMYERATKRMEKEEAQNGNNEWVG